jgi:hypothetical protein
MSEMMANGKWHYTYTHNVVMCGVILIACYGLGACFTAMSRLTEAEEALSESVRIYAAVLPEGDPQITQG